MENNPTTITVDATVVDDAKKKVSSTMESAATGCSCSSCCLTGCLIPILIVILIWIGCILAKIANHKEEPKQPTTEDVQQDAPTK